MMSEIKYHIPDFLLAAYASGALEHAYSLIVASHVSVCAECSAGLGAHQTVGGVVLDRLPAPAVAPALRERVLARLDATVETAPAAPAGGVFPGPVTRALRGGAPRWRSLGFGARQCILPSGDRSSVRLLYIPPGQGVPEHGHNGLEMTLVLQGSFHDDRGAFGVGDVEVADEELDHSPVAGNGQPCVCIAATNAPLRFKALFPRLLQPIFGI